MFIKEQSIPSLFKMFTGDSGNNWKNNTWKTLPRTTAAEPAGSPVWHHCPDLGLWEEGRRWGHRRSQAWKLEAAVSAWWRPWLSHPEGEDSCPGQPSPRLFLICAFGHSLIKIQRYLVAWGQGPSPQSCYGRRLKAAIWRAQSFETPSATRAQKCVCEEGAVSSKSSHLRLRKHSPSIVTGSIGKLLPLPHA